MNSLYVVQYNHYTNFSLTKPLALARWPAIPWPLYSVGTWVWYIFMVFWASFSYCNTAFPKLVSRWRWETIHQHSNLQWTISYIQLTTVMSQTNFYNEVHDNKWNDELGWLYEQSLLQFQQEEHVKSPCAQNVSMHASLLHGHIICVRYKAHGSQVSMLLPTFNEFLHDRLAWQSLNRRRHCSNSTQGFCYFNISILKLLHAL